MDEFKVPVVAPEPRKEQKKPEEKEPPKQLVDPKIPNPYKVPKWSTTPDPKHEYKFEVLKSGVIIEEVKDLQKKPFWTFGRLENNDINMAHPTISRHHAVLQYRPPPNKDPDAEDKDPDPSHFNAGWYIFDLGSTHGTSLNKSRIPPHTYIRVHVGHMIKLGSSTRCYILHGPDFDEEPESELTITEMKEMKKKELEHKEALKNQQKEDDGVTWGMGEDADEETDLTVNPYSLTNNEELFLEDPKKTLRGFFEREGHELEYKAEEMSAGTFVCSIELPITDGDGNPIRAEVCHKGKKKDCVLQCALEACRLLDRRGVLRQANHEPMKRKLPAEDSDEDDFLDRTGDIERKKQRKAALNRNTALTYEELVKQETELLEKLANVEAEINEYQEISKNKKEKRDAPNDDLDSFMTTLSSNVDIDKTKIRKLRVEQQSLEADHKKLQRLIKIAKPAEMPSLNPTDDAKKKSKLLPLFGKRTKLKVTHTTTRPINPVKEAEYESEEDEKSEPTEKQSEKETESEKKEKKEKMEKEEIKQENKEEKKVLAQMEIDTSDAKQIEKEASNNDMEAEEENSNGELKDREDTAESKEDKGVTLQTNSIKRRNRTRVRTKCRDNDMEDVQSEDPEKYSGWVPPQNQSGDGLTELNEKFGY